MAKNDNSGLGKAKRQKKDEFYTRLEDIERELAHYKAHFKYHPEQFEIVGVLNHGCDSEFDLAKPILNGKELYTRVAIRRRK